MKWNKGNAKRVFAAALAAVTLLSGCGTKQESVNTYSADNGMYSVSLPGEWENGEDMGVPGMMNLTRKDGMETVMLGMTKNQISNQSDVKSLSDFYSYIDTNLLNGTAASSDLKDAESVELPGTVSTLAKEGTMSASEGGKGKLFVECAETENAYYLFMFTGTLGYSKKLASIKQNMKFEELDVPSQESLSDTLKWFNASCAIITSLNGGNLSLVAGFEPGEQIEASIKEMLTRDWEVSDRASMDETIDWLLTEGQNADALETLESLEVNGMSRDELKQALLQNGYTTEEQTVVLSAFDAQAAYGDKAVLGWDLSRAMSMFGWGYLAGFYTYEEAMDKSLETAQTIQQSFDSWDDYINSYFLGYSYWSGEDPVNQTTSAYKRQQMYEEMKAEENGPYSVDFAAVLQKEW